MQKTKIAMMVIIALSGGAQAETLTLKGNRMTVEVETQDGKLTTIAFTNHQNGDVIRTDKLFAIKGTDDKLTPSTDFVVDRFEEEHGNINLTLKNKYFMVSSALSLDDPHAYSTVS
ncbi:hypothetical protein [Aeromonas sobria]|nr:hypothetical protein [Aeromonas sobria]